MVRIQFLNQHYAPDTASSGQHLTDVAEHLAGRGHEVRVLCAQVSDTETKPPAREVRNGVSVRRVVIPTGAGRFAGYAAFHAAAAARALTSRWADMTVTLTTPPMLGLWGSLARRIYGGKHVTYLMDHHPDAEFEAGMVARSSITGRILESVYRWTLKNATRNVVLGPYQARRVLERGVPASRVTTIPIWSWAEEVRATAEEREQLRRELGWRGFVVLYSGNAGHVHRFDELLAAMKVLGETNPDVHFAFVGGGPRRKEIEAFAGEHGLRNASFHPHQARDRVGALLTAADAHFVSLRREHVGVSVPSKLYGQLASARPVFFVGPARCETADDLRASGGGTALEIGDVDGLVDGLRAASADREACLEAGNAGRAWFANHREKAVGCRAWAELIEALARPERSDAFAYAAEGECASSR